MPRARISGLYLLAAAVAATTPSVDAPWPYRKPTRAQRFADRAWAYRQGTKRGRRLVQVGYMRRFDPAYVEMKAVLQSGKLGRPLFFHCVHRNLSAPPWFDSKMAISNSAVHEIDISRWLLEEELASIQVFQPATSTPTATVAPVFLVMRTASGKIVNVENNNNGGYGYDVKGELACEKGAVSLKAPLNSEVSSGQIQGTSYPADWRPRPVRFGHREAHRVCPAD